jgi:hypothetical protein
MPALRTATESKLVMSFRALFENTTVHAVQYPVKTKSWRQGGHKNRPFASANGPFIK